MKNYLICTIILFALLAGCAPKTWQKDGVTQNDYEGDKLECKAEANEAGYGHNIFNLCMSSKGYSLKTKQDPQQK